MRRWLIGAALMWTAVCFAGSQDAVAQTRDYVSISEPCASGYCHHSHSTSFLGSGIPVKQRTCLQCINLANVCPKSLRDRKSRVVVSEQPPHFPYQAMNLYYYDRPYQHSQSRLQSEQSGMVTSSASTMQHVYEQLRTANSPTIGSFDSLEFADLPSPVPHQSR